MIIVVCGVSGCGKSTIGAELAKQVFIVHHSLLNEVEIKLDLNLKLGFEFADADAYHPESNKQLMRQGIPLNDDNRLSWLLTLHNLLLSWNEENKNGVLACSALKQKYRHLLNSGLCYAMSNEDTAATTPTAADYKLMKPFEVNLHILFVLLNYEKPVLIEHLTNRTHEIVKGTSILDSQLATLETPPPDHTDCLWTADGGARGYLCLEKSFANNTFYYFYVLNCSRDESVAQLVNRIANLIPVVKKLMI